MAKLLRSVIVEAIVGISLAGLVLAIAVPALNRYTPNAADSTAAIVIVGLLVVVVAAGPHLVLLEFVAAEDDELPRRVQAEHRVNELLAERPGARRPLRDSRPERRVHDRSADTRDDCVDRAEPPGSGVARDALS